MQTVEVNYYQRAILWNMLGNHTAPNLAATAVFLRLIEKTRFSDKESRESQFSSESGGQISWRLPVPNYGDKTLELEDTEADALVTMIKNAPTRVMDSEWLGKIVERLEDKLKTAGDEPPAMPSASKGQVVNGSIVENIGTRKPRQSVR